MIVILPQEKTIDCQMLYSHYHIRTPHPYTNPPTC